MIRFLIVVLFVVLFLVLSIPLMAAEWILGKLNKDLKNRSSQTIVNWAFRCVVFLSGTHVIIRGLENVPKDTAVLYAANHRSFYDIILTYPLSCRPTGYVAKIETAKIPLLSSWMRLLNCLFLDRKDIRQGMKTILAGVEKAKAGISIFIFPEGTRNRIPDTFLPFHEGSFKIAEKAGVPIVPVTINNSGAVFEDHFPKIKRATVVIEYGEPIYLNTLSKEERKGVGAKVQKIIQETYFRNRSDV